MRVSGIHHINIRASKLLVAEMKAFYEAVLGLRTGWRPPFTSAGHWLYLEGTPVIHLVEDDSIHDRAEARGPVVDHVAFSCTGMSEFEHLLRTKGIPFRMTDVPDTAQVQLIFVDPAGNGVELHFANRAA